MVVYSLHILESDTRMGWPRVVVDDNKLDDS